MPSECDDYAFCKVCDDSFSIARGGGNEVSHGHIAELNKLGRQICLLGNFSKTADSKAVSVSRAEVMCSVS